MGPRLVSRGKGKNSMRSLDWLRASMGPRLVSRGKNVLGGGVPIHDVLQWGRDLLVAERQ